MLESKIESACVNWARANDWLSYKFVSPGNSGVPDRMFLRNGKTVFVEFKQPGGKTSTLQKRQIAILESHDFRVFIISSLEGFKIAFQR